MNHHHHHYLTRRMTAACMRPLVCAIILVAGLFSGCKKPTLPNSVTASQAATIAAASAPEVRDVRFGNRFILLGASQKMADEGLQLELVWKSSTKEHLHCHVAIHVVDAAGKILAQADYEQSKSGGDVQPDMIWRDTVTFTREQLPGATAIAVGLMEGNEQWLAADRGPRDWEDRRLLIPLAEKMPPAGPPSPIEGYLEAVNVKEVVGWAWNKDQPQVAVDVELLDGDRVITRVPAADARDDLRKNNIGDGKHGFAIPTPEHFKDGAIHSVHVRVVGEVNDLKNSPRSFTIPSK